MFESLIFKNRWREKVVVNLKSGDSFAGVLWSSDKRAIVLRNASALAAGDNRTDVPLDGEVIVLLADVLFLQRP